MLRGALSFFPSRSNETVNLFLSEPEAMIRRRPLIFLILIACLGISGGIGFRVWRVKTAAQRELTALGRAQICLKTGKPDEALALADRFSARSKDPAWILVQLQAVTRLQILPRLELLLDRNPDVVLKDEAASLLLARGFMQATMAAPYDRVRSAWRGREHQLGAWRLLDADLLLLTGDNRKAEKLLRTGQTATEADVPRLVRLALVTANRDLAGACRLLDQAVALQPTNCIARWSRGEILERIGNIRLARVEYVSALAAAPGNSYWRDQLAEFYLRCHNHDLALDTWIETPANPAPDFIQLKVRFFQRVFRPASSVSSVSTASGELERLVQLIDGMKPGRFFDPDAFNKLPYASTYAAQRPEVFWLRVLEALQSGNEASALDLLTTEPARLKSWDPDLAGALQRVLSFRRKQSFNPSGIVFKSLWGETNRPPFYALIERAAREEQTAPDHKAKLEPEFAALLRGSNIFSQVFLTAGWREAAVQLRRSARVEVGEPDSLSAAYAQALRLNRSPRSALDFLGTGALPLATTLVRAELLLEVGRRDEALAQLKGMAKHQSSAGVRAASLLAIDAGEKKDYGLARRYVSEQPLLAQSDLGREILARMALAENRNSEAETIYRGIANTSIEAKTWLARKAFSEGNREEARRIITESLAVLPDSPELRESLAAIDKAEVPSKARAPL